MATALENAIAARDSAAALLAAELAYQESHGPKPDYSLDGESYQWSAWRKEMEDRIERMTKLIQLLGGPYVIRSRARA